jgi:hypothetical protein
MSCLNFAVSRPMAPSVGRRRLTVHQSLRVSITSANIQEERWGVNDEYSFEGLMRLVS